MELSLFDHFPEPVFYVEQSTLRYSNQAALALEPQWSAGAAVPAALDLEPDKDGVFFCTLAGRNFQASVIRMENGRLLVLRPSVQAVSSPMYLTLAIQLREQIHNIQNAARLLAPVVEANGDENDRRYLAVLNQSFYRLFRLARHLDMAEWAGQTGNGKVEKHLMELAEFCQKTAYGAARLAELAGVSFQDDVPGGIIPCMGNQELLEVMLLELISNAIKAAGKGGKAGLKLSSNGRQAMITIWDNGLGMSQTELAAVTGNVSPENLPKPGTGLRLGLPIARRIAAVHGGTILMENREGRGLQVTVSLPLQKPFKGVLRTPILRPPGDGGFSPLLTFLSDVLPWQAFME